MAIIFTETMPAGVSLEFIDAVTEEMGVIADPPAGMIIHTHYEEGGQVRIVDVWESAQAYDKFSDDRLRPALQKVADAQHIDLTAGPPPEIAITEVHAMVLGH
jgi:hypothetical protein